MLNLTEGIFDCEENIQLIVHWFVEGLHMYTSSSLHKGFYLYLPRHHLYTEGWTAHGLRCRWGFLVVFLKSQEHYLKINFMITNDFS